MIVFAYGSNVSNEQMRQRCPTAECLGSAWMPNHRLGFWGWSRLREGAVCGVFRARRAMVPGTIWRLSPPDVDALDAAEGHPSCYRRQERIVVGNGLRFLVQVYLPPPGTRFDGTPSEEYLRTIADGYRQWGFPMAPLARGVWGKRASRLFVYGTLMNGQVNHAMIEDGLFEQLARTDRRYALVDLGRFPGMVRGSGTVHGEVFWCERGHVLELDVFEGHPHHFRRTSVRLLDGSQAAAYMYRGDIAHRPFILSGDWRAHASLPERPGHHPPPSAKPFS
jgi:gamma-glutamylaminecyclotransferase